MCRCGEGLYSLSGGSSNGSVGTSLEYPCFTCPRGGRCTGGSVTATAHHWGAADQDGQVTFAPCPPGYGPLMQCICTGPYAWMMQVASHCVAENRGSIVGYTQALFGCLADTAVTTQPSHVPASRAAVRAIARVHCVETAPLGSWRRLGRRGVDLWPTVPGIGSSSGPSSCSRCCSLAVPISSSFLGSGCPGRAHRLGA